MLLELLKKLPVIPHWPVRVNISPPLLQTSSLFHIFYAHTTSIASKALPVIR